MKRKAQSEMVGFGLIIIMVAVLLLIFLSISLKKTNEDITENYEVEAFIQSILSYTTDCEIDYGMNYHNLRRLIFDCAQNKPCLDERPSCEVLNQTLGEMLESSWKVGNDTQNKGYLFNLTIEGEELIGFEKGNKTNVNKGTSQVFDQGVDIIFVVYN